MTSQMSEILAYIDLLSAVDTATVEPMAHAVEVADVFREDAVRPSLAAKRPWPTPRNATRCYLVPAVLGEES